MKVLVALSFLGLLALSSGFRLKPSAYGFMVHMMVVDTAGCGPSTGNTAAASTKCRATLFAVFGFAGLAGPGSAHVEN